jgi:uncharacterized protein
MRFGALLAVAFLLGTPITPVGAAADNALLAWEGWSPDLFARAKAEQRFVILDLEAVWCHWCHVMERTTYADPKVVALLKSKYLPVRVDQDANPDLSSRYGDWGWPATIIFASDGSEIVKWRGYLPPERMAALLKAVIEDPSRGPSVVQQTDIVPAESPLLDDAQRAGLLKRSDAAYDTAHGGFGPFQRFIDTDSMDLLLAGAEKGDETAAKRARQTLDAALALIDREWGGIYQYSDTLDWSSPHYEKIMWYQANGLRQYVQAYALWKDPRYLAAAQDIERFLLTKLRNADGAFYVSQDADIDEAMPGKSFYALSAEQRAKLGREPHIDTHIYARENGWAVSGLLALYDAVGDETALRAAERAAQYIRVNRAIEGGGFRHGDHDQAGPYLGDTLAMGQAALDLYAATGERDWLDVADHAGAFIAARFKDEAGGFRTTVGEQASEGVFAKEVKQFDEQVAATRFANKLYRYLGKEEYRALAEHGARYLASPAILDEPRPLPGILLVDRELSQEPTHITVVGGKDEPEAATLHAAALAFPALYKRVDWWDKREGPLPNPDVQYPELDQPAAFACTNRICSQPIFEPEGLAETVTRMLAASGASAVQ